MKIKTNELSSTKSRIQFRVLATVPGYYLFNTFREALTIILYFLPVNIDKKNCDGQKNIPPAYKQSEEL